MTRAMADQPDTSRAAAGEREAPRAAMVAAVEGRISPARRFRWLGGAALVAMVTAQVIGFLISPAEQGMGHLQKILYVHVPAAWMALLACAVVFVFSLLYLWRKNEQHDLLAASAAEVAVVLTALFLALGSLWGRWTWGVWWTWDARLASSAVLLVILAGYLALRAFTDDVERRARWSAAVGILGFMNAGIVYMSVRWWRTLHQPPSSPETLFPGYTLSLRLNAIAFLILLIYLVARRYEAARLERRAEAQLEEIALARGGTHV